MPRDFIRIENAREHNLKNVSVSIPRDKLVVITGPSGSGKSSLAFDTLFAEGQRKYVESLSSYARQFLDQLKKPDVDAIEGLSPAIAIEQRIAAGNPRSLVSTTTEIYDYLRLLFANMGTPHCPDSGTPMRHMSVSEITDEILGGEDGTRIMILAPIVKGEIGEFRDVTERMAREGFVRARVDGQFIELAPNLRIGLDPTQPHDIEVVVDRLVINPKIRVRLAESVEAAVRWGRGLLLCLSQGPTTQDKKLWNRHLYSTHLYSVVTGKTYEPVTPKHFSFNAPSGACDACHGLGQEMRFDPALLVPDPGKSLEQGAIVPWHKCSKPMVRYYQAVLRSLADHYHMGMDVPFRSFPDRFRDVLFNGTKGESISMPSPDDTKIDSRPFEGVMTAIQNLYEESESEITRNRLKAFMSSHPCHVCHGKRLKPEILAVTLPFVGTALDTESRIPGISIMDFCSLSIQSARHYLDSLQLSPYQEKVCGELVKEIRSRLIFLDEVGLGYLNLNRESGSLSGGEAQRIRLATQIGAGLMGVLYILDEPSIGLHQRDNDRLLATLNHLKDLGNSVIVVEHDEDTIRAAEYILDLGPGAGVKGGYVVAEGDLKTIENHPHSLTGKYLRGEYAIHIPHQRKGIDDFKGWLEILDATANNLKHIDARFPIGALSCVTGVSGSGKSTLIEDILRKSLFQGWYGSRDKPGAHREIRGAEQFDKAIVIDQSPIGRTPRSNPATYTGMFSHIRDLFAQLPAARVRGYGPGRFSFNVRGGRCEKCQGDGLLQIEMHFLPPVYVQCENCEGKRYNRETLEINYKGLNIADVLNLTVDEAIHFFRSIPKVQDPCQTLAEVGLGYITLGQSGTTLSGGEAQRIKLAAELSRKSTGRTLYIMDEPTTGLHFHDIAKLLEVIMKLRNAGNTILIIEHNLDIIKCADWIVDLGPDGGEGGGTIVCEGSPEDVASCDKGYTSRYLRRVLDRSKKQNRELESA